MEEETDEEFEAFLNKLDEALTEQFGPDHQKILSEGKVISQFEW